MQNDSIPTWLLIQAFVFIINNTEDKIIGLSPFETIYLRGNKFPSNVPSLSISKLKSYKPFTNEFYKTAIEILSKVKQKQLRKISEVEKVKMYDINVVVIIKSYRVSGKSDKILPAYSTKLYKIIERNPFTHTYIIEKLEDDSRMSKQRHKVHHRIVKKILKRISLPKGPDKPLLDGPEKEESNPKITGESQNPRFEEKRKDSIKNVEQSRNPSRYNLRSAKHFSE